MNDSALHRKRTERGVILTLLVQTSSTQTAFKSLWRMMDRRGFSISKDELTFHLQKVLEPAGLVELVRARECEFLGEDLAPDAIVFVKVTVAGVTVVNGKKHEEVEQP